MAAGRGRAGPPLLTLNDIALSFGGDALLDGAHLSVSAGDRICFAGRNGSGKSTLLKIAAGMIEPDRGTRFVKPGTTVRYLRQEPDFSGYDTVLDYVLAGLGPGDEPYEAHYLLEKLNVTSDGDPRTLSGGEARRAALAQVMAPKPDIIMLDEPTNHLDLPAIEWLENELEAFAGALIVISHDRRFLTRLTRSVLWLDRGVTRAFGKGFDGFEAWRDQVLEDEVSERHKLDRQLVREAHWLRYGVTARRKRNQGRLRALEALRQKKRDQRAQTGLVNMTAARAKASGRLIVEAKAVSKAFGGLQVVRDFSIRVNRGDRIGIAGPNGAGKTTLIRLLTGELAPDSGDIRLGVNLETVILDQKRARLDGSATLKEVLTGGSGDTVMAGGAARHVASYMKDFLFAPEQAGTAVERLSGGERGRLILARAFATPSNFLVLDEPTNDLDLETLDLLQELLAGYDGTVLLVSHDRDFLDRVATAMVVPQADGRWAEYAGGYSDMTAQRKGTAPAACPVRAAGAKPARPADKPARTPGTPAKSPVARMTYKDKHALETLPGEIAGLEARIGEISETLADPELYGRDIKTFEAASKELDEASALLAQKEEKWLELEMLKDELEAAR